MPQDLIHFETYLVHEFVWEKWCGDVDGIL
jgi:hypothetical protein